ncbi:hypothetical protein HanXRQr2_Chr15g0684701 [Helianthus annuus]|uniref:Uncharacterized protein n=1 Tax=Helianthus annuus TaxID=4232 RepID=A0A9K3DZ39_HELAN|nr:hypothetical protein HanXRQr2_Chr15g0684701 [Helianthus annuus]
MKFLAMKTVHVDDVEREMYKKVKQDIKKKIPYLFLFFFMFISFVFIIFSFLRFFFKFSSCNVFLLILFFI